MPTARTPWMGACLAACLLASDPAVAAGGDGLTPGAEGPTWTRWQGRIALVTTTAPSWRADLSGADRTGLKVGSLRLLGDYYFASQGDASGLQGGFRATSGLLVGSRTLPWSALPGGPAGNGIAVELRQVGSVAASADAGTVPYVGLGWSGASARSGWSFSADLGVVSLNPGNAVKFGRAFGNPQNLDDVLREMRLSPMLQLGASYSF